MTADSQQVSRPQPAPGPTRRSRPVVVGIDGSTYGASALDWAADEADRTERELLVVTTTGDFSQPVAHATAGVVESFDYGARYQDLLDRATSSVTRGRPKVRLVPRVRSGDPVAVLVELSREAEIVVVGKRGHSAFRRLLVGSTSIAVAGRAHGPVVVVPEGWGAATPSSSPLVVGIDLEHENGPALGFAFRRAAALGVPLIAVHAWHVHPGLPISDDDRGRWAVDAKRAVDDELAGWIERFPDVEVHSLQAEGHPSPVLLEAAERAQLLVLGRTSGERRLTGLPFGSVARAVLHYSDRPVAVVPSS
jgi:nucleotide-binding universal stress UspA family protein